MKSVFLGRLKQCIQEKSYSVRAEQTYIYWAADFIRFHHYRSAGAMGNPDDIRRYLSHLAIDRKVTMSTQKTALNALAFVYRQLLNIDPGDFSDFTRAKTPGKLPLVLGREELVQIFDHMRGYSKLSALLMFGSGLRVMESVRLRVQDIDFGRLMIRIFEGKGRKNRFTTLAPEMVEPLRAQVLLVQGLFQQDQLDPKWDGVYLPNALDKKYPRAPFEFGWQYLFPSDHFSRDPRTGKNRRHHMSTDAVQRNLKNAVRKSGINKPATCHTLRHSLTATDGGNAGFERITSLQRHIY